MAHSEYTCNCDVIHEDVVNEVRNKLQTKEDYIQLASLFKLFGDGTRVQILHALEQSELCVCDLAVLLGVTKSAVSPAQGIAACQSCQIPQGGADCLLLSR